jgi:hypothetical protein
VATHVEELVLLHIEKALDHPRVPSAEDLARLELEALEQLAALLVCARPSQPTDRASTRVHARDHTRGQAHARQKRSHSE